MKLFILAIMALAFAGTAHAEYHDYNKFQKVFELPLDAKNVQEKRTVIDYEKSVFCATDGEGNIIYPNCDDVIVYKEIDVTVRRLTVSLIK